MSPNLDRYGITASHEEGVSEILLINFIEQNMELIEVQRKSFGDAKANQIVLYVKVTEVEAKALTTSMLVNGHTFRLRHFYSIRCEECGGFGHNETKCGMVHRRKNGYMMKLYEAFELLTEEDK
jgi:hypothetical protein